jgi:KilA-N domain
MKTDQTANSTDIVKFYKGQVIRIREDKYVCLSDMAMINNRKVAHWLALIGTEAYLKALSVAIGIPIGVLLEKANGAATWGHPKLAIRFAQWCSEEFAVQVDCWIDELMTTGKVKIDLEQPHIPDPTPFQLPSRELALQTAVAVVTIQDTLSKSNPRLAQILIDYAMNDVIEQGQPSERPPEEKLHGLVSIAMSMGIKTNLTTRSALGNYVAHKKFYRVQEKRLCNGDYRDIWCYRDNAETREAIQEWHNKQTSKAGVN